MTKRYFRRRVGVPVCVFSIEMTGESLGFRMLFSRAGVDMAQYKQGFQHSGDNEKLAKAASQLAQAKIYIDDATEQSITQIAAKARRMVKQYGIKLFVLDYIQLVDVENGNGFDRVKELTKVSKKIRALKKELGVPWLVLAQMNRNIETAERDRKPVLSDLKDCGALEQDADWVLFTYKTTRRELEQGDPSDQDVLDEIVAKHKLEWSRVPVRVDLVIPKHRDGPMGEAKMVFLKNLAKFEDWHLYKVRMGVEGMKAGERERTLGKIAEEDRWKGDGE